VTDEPNRMQHLRTRMVRAESGSLPGRFASQGRAIDEALMARPRQAALVLPGGDA